MEAPAPRRGITLQCGVKFAGSSGLGRHGENMQAADTIFKIDIQGVVECDVVSPLDGVGVAGAPQQSTERQRHQRDDGSHFCNHDAMILDQPAIPKVRMYSLV